MAATSSSTAARMPCSPSSAARDQVRKLIEIGTELGRVLRPTAFDVANDETLVVADAPFDTRRVQVFHSTGTSLGGFTIPGREVPLIVMEGIVLSGIGSLEYTGQSVLMSQPQNGSLVVEHGLDGRTLRTFGTLRATGHEQDQDVHVGLNAGLVVINPRGGFYYVFLAGVPLFRSYDAAGALIFERHIEGTELDETCKSCRRPGRVARIRRPRAPAHTACSSRGGRRSRRQSVDIAGGARHAIYDTNGDKRRGRPVSRGGDRVAQQPDVHEQGAAARVAGMFYVLTQTRCRNS